jgi:hypothetical protein
MLGIHSVGRENQGFEIAQKVPKAVQAPPQGVQGAILRRSEKELQRTDSANELDDKEDKEREQDSHCCPMPHMYLRRSMDHSWTDGVHPTSNRHDNRAGDAVAAEKMKDL